MSKAGITVFVHGIYLLVLGITLLFLPNTMLVIFTFPRTTESWIRVLGLVLMVLAYYLIQAARFNLTAFFRATIYGRIGFMGGVLALVLLGYSKPMLLLFGFIDLIGALRTARALKRTAQYFSQ